MLRVSACFTSIDNLSLCRSRWSLPSSSAMSYELQEGTVDVNNPNLVCLYTGCKSRVKSSSLEKKLGALLRAHGDTASKNVSARCGLYHLTVISEYIYNRRQPLVDAIGVNT